ncbi:MAG TPA: hypothetical protein P5555_01030 [Candidatus Paceibacterota bacterium]|nr:hypothetical protein [Verrucomicrobiota bacterium]HRZ43756.1 hypothetical protein [Candidatus Paceibacterota bacterium]HRZ91351.1 hypothetical protein [Candidatus Paceibacterota bacterium]
MEAILTILAIIVLSALSNLMRRRTPDEAPAPPAGSEEPWPAAPPPPTARPADQPASPSAPSRGFDWEKELRRLLEVGPAEEKPPPLPPPPAAPPPVIQPPPAALEPRAPRLRPRPAPAPAVRASTALPQPPAAAAQLAPAGRSQPAPAPMPMTAPAQSLLLDRSKERAMYLDWLRTPRGLRQAVVAQTIIGPPRAFDDL